MHQGPIHRWKEGRHRQNLQATDARHARRYLQLQRLRNAGRISLTKTSNILKIIANFSLAARTADQNVLMEFDVDRGSL